MFSLLRDENLEKDETDMQFDATQKERINQKMKIEVLERKNSEINDLILKYYEENIVIREKLQAEYSFQDIKILENEEAQSLLLKILQFETFIFMIIFKI